MKTLAVAKHYQGYVALSIKVSDLKKVIDKIVKYLSGANVQLRAHNELSDECMRKTLEGVRAVGLLVNAQDPERYFLDAANLNY